MFNQNFEDSIRAVQQKQQEDKMWKDEVLAVLKSIDDKLAQLVGEK